MCEMCAAHSALGDTPASLVPSGLVGKSLGILLNNQLVKKRLS